MMLDYKKILESLLRELIDKKIISEWYCNGAGYFWKYNEKDERILKLEKENAELENKMADIKANCDLAIEGRDVKIKELEQQIKKMKCCENCKYNSYWGDELHCNYGLKEALQEDKLDECKNMDKWEIKENEIKDC